MTNPAQVIGIDLGGTAIKLGRYAETGLCLETLTVATPQPATPKAIAAAMVTAIDQLDPDRQVRAIGIGTPGPADAAGRVARVAINLEGWQDVPLAEWIETQTGLPAVLANDANCAGLGEAWLGSGCDFSNLIVLTLGTGVGGAIILDGKLFVGHMGTAGVLGLITLNPQGPPCNSCHPGSLAQHCTVKASRRETDCAPGKLPAQAPAADATAIGSCQQ